MHYLDPDSFNAEGPGVNSEEVTALGHAFIPCLLNRWAAMQYKQTTYCEGKLLGREADTQVLCMYG
jgi:hypothetical protein